MATSWRVWLRALAPVGGLWAALLAADVALRLGARNAGHPAAWCRGDAGVYLTGALWALGSWALMAQVFRHTAARARRLRLGVAAVAVGSLVAASLNYRAYHHQSPGWQVVRFMVSEPDNTRRIVTWSTGPLQLVLWAVVSAAIVVAVSRSAARLARLRPLGWPARLLGAGAYVALSVAALFLNAFHDPLPSEAAAVAALTRFAVQAHTDRHRLSRPMRPRLPAAAPKARPSVLVIIHESLRADAVFPMEPYSDVDLDARALSPHGSRIPERQAEGFWALPRARANAAATDVSVPSIVSHVDPGGAASGHLSAHTLWSLGQSTGARTFLFSAQSYRWAFFDEFFLDHHVDTVRTGLDLAPDYVNDIGVDDMRAVDEALAHMAERQRAGERFVGVVHFSGTHIPGFPGPGVAPSDDLHQRWRQAARYIDQCAGRLVDGVLALPGADDIVIVSTSDHGETLESSHPVGRLGSYYEDVVRVPMWLRVSPALAAREPGWAAALAAWQARDPQNLQVLPTVRDLLGLDEGGALVDLSATPSLVRPPPPGPDLVAGQSTTSFRAWDQDGLYVLRGPHKLILSNEFPSPELYDLSRDPREQHNLWSDPAARQDALAWAVPFIESGAERAAACRRTGANCVLPVAP